MVLLAIFWFLLAPVAHSGSRVLDHAYRLVRRLRAAAFFRMSLLLYRFLPELRYVQLPLRWLLCLNVGFALLVTMATRRWWSRAAGLRRHACGLGLCMASRSAPMVGHCRRRRRNAGQPTDRCRATTASTSMSPTAWTSTKSRKTRAGSASKAMALHASASPSGAPNQSPSARIVSQPGKLVLKLFNYPAWRVEVNGRPVRTGMLAASPARWSIPVEAGDNQVRVTFARTRDREIGGLISLRHRYPDARS